MIRRALLPPFVTPCNPTSGNGKTISRDHSKMDTLGFEPRAFRMRSGCDTTTPCARLLRVMAYRSYAYV